MTERETEKMAADLLKAVEEGNLLAVTSLLDQGVDVNCHELVEGLRDNCTPLIFACWKGYLPIVQLLIERGADVDSLSHDKNSTALMLSCQKDHFEIVQLLIQHNASLTLRDRNHNTALHYSCLHGHVDIAAYLLDHGAFVNEKGEGNSIPLMFASHDGHLAVVKLLIERDTDINCHDSHNNTALHYACLTGRVEIAEYLLDHGALINDNGEGNFTPLIIASQEGYLPIVELLVQRGADITCREKNQNTALHAACAIGHVEIATLLLDHGALINDKGDDDKTPLMWASNNGHLAAVEMLIERGADITCREKKQSTALHIACFMGHIDIAACLLDQGAMINQKGTGGCTPLLLASYKGHLEVAIMLVRCGANISLRDKNQNSALHVACLTNQIDVASHLMNHGLQINDRGLKNQTCLHKAIIKGHVNTVRLLVQRGADINTCDAANRSALHLANSSKSTDIKAIVNHAASFQNKRLTAIPGSAFDQISPFALHLNNNKLEKDVWDTLTSSPSCRSLLVGLFLQSNPSLGVIPESVANLAQLMYLSVAACGLSWSDVTGLAQCSNLVSLDLSNNSLGELPIEFSQLQHLFFLNIASCNMFVVPAVIMQLSSLCCLDLSDNPLHRLPVALADMPYLTNLKLIGCPLTTIPAEYHHRDVATLELLKFLKSFGLRSERIYRSKLLLVGYDGVGKTTLLRSLFPPSITLLKKNNSYISSLITSFVFDPWEPHRCRLRGTKLVLERSSQSASGWEDAEQIELADAIIEVDKTDEITWSVRLRDQTWKHEFRCHNPLEREEWINACKFQATDGITFLYREISHKKLQAALTAGLAAEPPIHACVNWRRQNNVPKDKSLKLAICDFAGQHEYQDSHQLFLTSRSIYLVLWDVTPSKREAELAKLRHWLSTLQLHLDSDQLRSSVLVYIVGTHADDKSINLQDANNQAKSITENIAFNLPHRFISAIDARNVQHVKQLKQHVLADLATQKYLGEEVPTSFLDLDQRLRVSRDRYRLQLLQFNRNSSIHKYDLPLLSRTDLVEQFKLDESLVTHGLSLMHSWGQIVYFGHVCSQFNLDDLVVSVPDWLAVSILGVVVKLQFQRSVGTGSAVVKHSSLARLFPNWWYSLASEEQDQVIEILYALELAFACDIDPTQPPFFEYFSVFPQLLPRLPPSKLEWVGDKNDTCVVVELNGIPMGFHTVLLSRLNNHFCPSDFTLSWQSGYLFLDEQQQAILVTIHEDTLRVRFCVSNSANVKQVLQMTLGTVNSPGVLRTMISERYPGVQIINEYVECICNSCQSSRKWHWNKDLAEQVDKDVDIQRLLKNPACRADLSQALLKHIQPNGRPHEFSISEIFAAMDDNLQVLFCDKSNEELPVGTLIQANDDESDEWTLFGYLYDLKLVRAASQVQNLTASQQSLLEGISELSSEMDHVLWRADDAL